MLFHPKQLGFTPTTKDIWILQIEKYIFRIRRSVLYLEREPKDREYDHWLSFTISPSDSADTVYKDLNLIVREAELKDVAYWKQVYMLPRSSFLSHDKTELAAHDAFVAHVFTFYRNQKLNKLLD